MKTMINTRCESSIEGDVLVGRACPVCLSPRGRNLRHALAEDFFQARGVDHANIVACQQCRIEYTNPVIRPDIANLQYTSSESGYNRKHFKHVQQLCWRDQFICLNELSHHILSEHEEVLDFGCGRGGFVYLCQKNNIRASGIDLNPHNIALGQSFGVQDLFTKDISDMNSNRYDHITSIHVFEHLENCYEIVEHFHRILKDSGNVFIIVPNFNAIKFYFNRQRYWDYPFQHINAFSANTLDYLFKQYDFKRIPIKLNPLSEIPNQTRKVSLSLALTKYLGNWFNIFPTILFCAYQKQ